MLTADDVKILETAEWLETHHAVGARSVVAARLHLGLHRYTQILLHLVIQPEVVSNPRWTRLAYKIQATAHGAEIARAERQLPKAS